MKLLKRDPKRGYLDSSLWVPKSEINLEGTQAALTFAVNDKRQVRFLQLYKETPHHLLVPREFWDVDSLPFPVVDGRPSSYAKVDIKSRITLDFKDPTRTLQRDAVEAMQKARGGILQLACGLGKAQPVDTPVLTPCGWKKIGELRPGDLVIGSDGLPTKVLSRHPQGELPVYRVTFEDETSTRCCEEHLWFTQTPGDRRKGLPGQVRSLRSIMQTLRNKAGVQHAVPRTQAVVFEEAEEVYEPWLIGFYLGDGSSAIYNGQRRVCFDKGDLSVHERIAAILGKYEESFRRSDDSRSNNKTTSLLFPKGSRSRLWETLTNLSLVGVSCLDKFIPLQYLRASIEERWQLLFGILEADGSVLTTGRSFSTSSPRLRDDVAELARSLGVRVRVESRQTFYTYKGEKRAGSPSWRLYLTHDRWGAGRYNNYQYIQTVEEAGIKDCVCIRVDAEDQLYVTEDFIVTHNTVCALELIAREQVPALIVVDNTHLYGQWMEAINQFLEVPGGIGQLGLGSFNWKDKSIVLATYSTLGQKADTFTQEFRQRFGLVIWDEAHHMAAPLWSKTADLFYGKRIGLTATPERVDGTHVIYDFHLGKVLYKDLIQELKPAIYFYWTGLQVDIADPYIKERVCDVNGELHTSMLSGYFGQWKKRLDLILNEVKTAERQGRRVLVLSYSITELINLFMLWGGATDLYSDVTYPTAKDVGETMAPLEMDDKTFRRMVVRKNQLESMLKNPEVKDKYPVKMQLKEVAARFQAHEVAKKCEREFEKRQRAFLKNILKANISNAGLMIGDIKLAERMKMLREKQIVFSIMKYGREGLDEQSLDTIFVCEPMSQKNSLQQLMGRVLRKKTGKKTPVVVFFEDDIGPMIGMCTNLRRHLRSWPINEGGPFHYEHVKHPTKGKRTSWTTL